MALLRLAQGQDDAADAAMRLALRETRTGRSRVHMLAAAVDIALARRDRSGARAAVDELADLARHLDAPFPAAKAAQAHGAVAVSEGHADAALDSEPGLYFVGLHFLYALSSEMIHGVGRDAARIAGIVASRAAAGSRKGHDTVAA